MKKAELDILLPIYHEEENIERVLDGIRTHVKTPHRVLAIFYNKLDPTIPAVKKIMAHDKTIIPIISSGPGLGKQLRTGFKNGIAPIFTIMMSDLSDDPRDIDKMVKKINNGMDIVSGSRYSRKGKRVGGSKLKALLSFWGCRTLVWFTGIPTYDTTNAFKTFRASLLKTIKLESKSGYDLTMELTVKAYYSGYKISEIPTIWKERDKGYSKFKLFRYVPQYLRWYILAIQKRFLSIFSG